MALDENLVAELVRRGVVTDTFRRLAPAKKLRLYETAVRLFGVYGYDGLSVDLLCHEAGISKGSFFQYFPSKSHLLEFAILVFDDYLAEWVREIRASEPSPLARARLQHLYEALVVNSKLFAAEETFYLFATSALAHAGVALEGIDLERHFHEYVTDIIGRGEETGEIRGDFEVELTAHLTSAVIGALVRRYYSGRRLPRRQMTEYLSSFLFDGIKP